MVRLVYWTCFGGGASVVRDSRLCLDRRCFRSGVVVKYAVYPSLVSGKTAT